METSFMDYNHNGFKLPNGYVDIDSDEMEYITGGIFGDHWDKLGQYSGSSGLNLMVMTTAAAAGLTISIATASAIVGYGAAPFTAGISALVGAVGSWIAGNLTTSMWNSYVSARDNYYSKGKSWAVYDHWGWFGTVLDGFETRAS
ncbi:hypothetical protein Mpt1_c11670 [Candidatus Methanoplasma termitum]|uniref:Uncharacterized protein n=1 Tax=Candidatus Methanoplasma termitum TaxID=1577791 RepID=A0A0A7LD81_9ARCH|nr:hypothetical protein [Candidatus Methanoplasma termitum]AIZ57029.1 hypothetical protein Mpt1_c11670 [Candidatus Methanoplasma termitum]